MDKFVVGSRDDGSGGRLISLMNTMAIADMLGWDFRFCWASYQETEGHIFNSKYFGDDKIKVNGHSMGKVYDIFEE